MLMLMSLPVYTAYVYACIYARVYAYVPVHKEKAYVYVAAVLTSA